MPGNTAHEYEVRESVNQVVDASRQLLDTDERPVRRDQHAKQHGCVRAWFIVGKDQGDALRQGLFQQEKVYEAWIRFSNGAQRDDRKPDAHGMAVKLMGVEGAKVLISERDATTHDFVMVDHPTFFIRDAAEYARFSDVLLKAKGKKSSRLYDALGFFVSGPARGLLTLALLSLFQWRIPTFLRLIKFASKRIANPVTTRYWSTTPYKLGETCMKFSAVPAEFPGGPPVEGPGDLSYHALAEFLRPAVVARSLTTLPSGTSRDYLREALARTLALQGAVFLFQVQLFKDDKTTPIDDPTVEWPEDAAPFQTVARIWIPKQTFDTSAQIAFGENLSFTPWHAIRAHEPLGEINNVRKDVYTKLSALRHRLNAVLEREPNPGDPDPNDSPPQWGDDSSAFCHVLQEELELIRQRRQHVEDPSADGGDGRSHATGHSGGPAASLDIDSLTRQVRLRALNEHTTGLALAGKGPGSATFAIGFLQGLASHSLLRRLDYLSAVAGGGCAAAWLVAWLKREGGHPENVERQLASSRIDQARATRQYLAIGEVVDEEPQPLGHLRSQTSSLYPQAGIRSTDTYITVLSRARNTVIHLLLVLPLLVLVVAGARLIVTVYGSFSGLTQLDLRAAQFDSRLGTPIFVLGVLALGLMFLSGALALGLALSSIAGSLSSVRRAEPRSRHEPDLEDPVSLVNRRIVSRVLVATLLFSFCLPPIWQGLRELFGNLLGDLSFGLAAGDVFSVRTIVDAALAHFTLLGWRNFLGHALLIGGGLAWWTSRRSRGEEAPRRKKFREAAFAAGVTVGLLIVLLEGVFRCFAQFGRLDLAATFIPPLALLIMVAGVVVEVAVSGRAASDAERGWCVALCSLLTKRAIYWIAGMATILYLPGVIFAAGGMTRAAIAVGWLATAGLGVVIGRYVLPRRDGARARLLTLLASLAARVFFVGLLGATALFVSLFANTPSLTAPGRDDDGPFAYYLQGIEGTDVLALLFLAIGFGIVYSLARRLIDVNLFSLDALEAGRLTAYYLGASRPIRAWQARWSQPRDQRVSVFAPSLAPSASEPVLTLRDADPLTGFDPGDDLALRSLCIGRKSGDDRVYWGPHLLINTTQITAIDGAIDWRTREPESFLLSPLYCGSQSVGYARTENEKPAGSVLPNLTLGRALAISGADGGLRKGSLSSVPLISLLTLVSARGGSWIEKPKPDGWAAASPRFGDLSVSASLGLSGGAGDFVYLSGGGEFEELGVYELIRRRCRYIVAVDAGEGGAPGAPRLATLIRCCRTDFGLRIDIDTRALAQSGPDRLRNVQVAIGKVHYGDVDQGGRPGVLVYISLSMTGNESRGIPLAFDDRQFESYRELGEHAAKVVFGDALTRLGEEIPDLARQPHVEYAPRLFTSVIERWEEAAKAEHEGVIAPARAGTQAPAGAHVRDRDRGRALPGADAEAGHRS
jgi:Catalase